MNEEDYKEVLENLIKDVQELGYEIHSIRKEFTYIFMQMSKTSRLTNERIDLMKAKLDKMMKYKRHDIQHH